MRLAKCRHHDCSMKVYSDQLAPRVDAQASADRTGIGGWFPSISQDRLMLRHRGGSRSMSGHVFFFFF